MPPCYCYNSQLNGVITNLKFEIDDFKALAPLIPVYTQVGYGWAFYYNLKTESTGIKTKKCRGWTEQIQKMKEHLVLQTPLMKVHTIQ